MRARHLLRFAVLLWAPAAAAVPIPWKNCGGPGDIITVQKADASVWPPQRGQQIVISYSATVGRDITSITGALKLSVSGLPVLDRRYGPTPYLIKAGPVNVQSALVVPLEIPSGSVFTIHFEMFDQSNRRALCVDLSIPVK